MNTVFDPAIVFISDTEWLDFRKREEFLEHFLDNIDFVDEYKITKVYWTNHLEEFLWNHPQLPPWRLDRDMQIKLVPIIYRKFQDNRQFIDCCPGTCSVQPRFANTCPNSQVFDKFLQLMHEMVKREESVFLSVGLGNQASSSNYYDFNCSCHSNSLTPELINYPVDWLNYLDLENDYWPSRHEEVSVFLQAIEITRKKDLNNKIFRYQYSFSKQFIKEIASTNENRKNILTSIAKRLTLSSHEASQDGSLQEEYINSRREYRFRVTGEARIHYKFLDTNEIQFLRYYGEGHHDNGL